MSQKIRPVKNIDAMSQINRLDESSPLDSNKTLTRGKQEREKALNFSSMTIPQARKVPTLKMYFDATGWMPADVLWEKVHKTISENNLTPERLRAAAVAWVGAGYKRGNVDGILEWAVNGIPGANGQKPTPPPVERDPFEGLKKMLAQQEARP
jgi:hypothetical protein